VWVAKWQRTCLETVGNVCLQGEKLIICIMWCVCVILIHFVSLVSAASHSQKGSHRDRREMIVYEEGLFE
jgi:uncharacterized membrane protein